jgi:hypothetical protein
MKKLFLFAAVMALFATASFAGNAYKLDDQKVDALFASSNDITMTASTAALSEFASNDMVKTTAGEKTVGGFLVRAFFCGQFALHRNYMGGSGLFFKYFCTFGVIACIDFWYVVFKGDDGLSKFKDSSEWVVWN